MGAAVAGAAYYVIKTPPLRRLAWRLVVTGLTGTLPAWFRQEVTEGWAQSCGPAARASSGATAPIEAAAIH
jgi:hypothetical protein